MNFVLDASARIAYLRDEPGAAVVAEALQDIESSCHAHALNLCEVFYDFHRASGPAEASQVVADLAEVEVITDSSLSMEVWQAAGALKAELRRISLADCFAIELADRLRATILTADHHEFDALATQANYRIRFIR